MPQPKHKQREAINQWVDVDFRVAAEPSEAGMKFRGYAAVFDSPSEDLGGFRETIAPGAFAKSLSQRNDIKMFVNHDWGRLLATRAGGTLKLSEDAYGLHVEADLPDTTDGRDMSVLAQRGDLFAMSFGFAPIRQDGDPDKGDKEVRLHEVKLYEVSPVTAWPAYRATSAGVRHLAELVEVEDETMTEALRALVADDGQLSDEQRDLLLRAIHARHPSRYVAASLAERQARLAQLIERTEVA